MDTSTPRHPAEYTALPAAHWGYKAHTRRNLRISVRRIDPLSADSSKDVLVVRTLRRGLRTSPLKDIWQRPLHHGTAHLRRLARLRIDDIPDPSDLFDYVLDIRYEKVQKDLLLWVLPFCMQAWSDDLRGKERQYGGLVENLYPALADGVMKSNVLDERERGALASFFQQAILEEIDDQRGLSFAGMSARPYRWITALTTYGVLFPDIDRPWTSWSELKTIGRAVAAVQYISCLVYGDTDNPVFSPWTREGGGGPPCLWELAGHLYTPCWLEPNTPFLTSVLEPTNVTAVLRQAVIRLEAEEEEAPARVVLADLAERTEVLGSRCEELPRFLSHQSQELRDWSL